MIGIVLAAGKAERMGNKCLLPLVHKWPDVQDVEHCVVVQSSLLALRKFEVGCVYVVVSRNSPVEAVLKKLLNRWRPEFIVQPQPLGVVDALQRVAVVAKSETILVAFGDNVYSRDCEVSKYHGCLGTVRNFANDATGWKELDGYDVIEKWAERSYKGGSTKSRLAGFVKIPGDAALDCEQDASLTGLLNHVGAHPDSQDWAWADVGTPWGYQNYLDRSHKF